MQKDVCKMVGIVKYVFNIPTRNCLFHIFTFHNSMKSEPTTVGKVHERILKSEASLHSLVQDNRVGGHARSFTAHRSAVHEFYETVCVDPGWKDNKVKRMICYRMNPPYTSCGIFTTAIWRGWREQQDQFTRWGETAARRDITDALVGIKPLMLLQGAEII